MGIFKFVIGFIIGWGFLSQFVEKAVANFLPGLKLGGVCLFDLGPWCLFGFGFIGLGTGLVVGLLLNMIK
mgnify:FL=1